MSAKVLIKKLIEKYEPGDYLCREGDLGREMFIVKTGKFQVLKEMGNTEMVLEELGPKDFYGEMALFGQNKRPTSVKALEPSETVVVTKKMLETQFMKIPEWLVSMIRTIANRIVTTSKGVKGHFKIGIEYSILKSMLYLGEIFGSPTSKGCVFPIEIARDEIQYTLGLSYDEIDKWLKRFNLVNLVSIKGGTGMIELPDKERIKLYSDFLISKSPEHRSVKIDIDADTRKSFDRIYKLLQR
ncbi:Crp/Fnr family transcriptional regulator [candidate division KSB1 bacterium]